MWWVLFFLIFLNFNLTSTDTHPGKCSWEQRNYQQSLKVSLVSVSLLLKRLVAEFFFFFFLKYSLLLYVNCH